MTFTRAMKTLVLTTALTLVAGTTFAQDTITVPVNATVANAITLTNVNPLEFGTLIAINDATQSASATVATTDALSVATTGAPALTVALSGTPTAGEITIQGISGQTINLTIQNVVDPTDGTDTLTLGTFIANVAGGGDGAVTVGTPFTYTATAGPDTMLVGATITTPLQAARIGDGAYAGSFDVVASY